MIEPSFEKLIVIIQLSGTRAFHAMIYTFFTDILQCFLLSTDRRNYFPLVESPKVLSTFCRKFFKKYCPIQSHTSLSLISLPVFRRSFFSRQFLMHRRRPRCVNLQTNHRQETKHTLLYANIWKRTLFDKCFQCALNLLFAWSGRFFTDAMNELEGGGRGSGGRRLKK